MKAEFAPSFTAISQALSQVFPISNTGIGLIARRTGVVAGVGLVTTFIGVVSLMAWGYMTTPASHWEQVLSERTASPVVDDQGRLVGAVFAHTNRDKAARYSALPISGALPDGYVKALLAVEDKHFGEKGPCHIDWASMVIRIVASGGAFGGSGLITQLVKQLDEDGNAPSEGLSGKVSRVISKLTQLGHACSLAEHMADKGGAISVLRIYAEHAPLLQGGGTTRGLEGAAYTLWGKPPADLTLAQQTLLAVAVKRPLMAQTDADADIECSLVYPKNGPGFEPKTAAEHPARQVWCRAIHRAATVAAKLYGGEQLEIVLKELKELQDEGTDLGHGWASAPDKKLINLSRRTAVLLPSVIRREMSREVEKAFSNHGLRHGVRLQVTIDTTTQQAMTAAFDAALADKRLQASLCMGLPGPGTYVHQLQGRCSKPTEATAGVMGIVSSRSGQVKAAYASHDMLDRRVQLGSVSKVAIALAAARAGMSPDQKVCPRQASDGQRPLRRVHGSRPMGCSDAECLSKSNLVDIASAFAASDNLAVIELGQLVGRTRIEKALADLGWSAPAGEDPVFSATFGTVVATPREILSGFTALAAEAHGQQSVKGVAVHVLQSAAGEQTRPQEGVKLPSLTLKARETLRALLEAPVSLHTGTLSFLKAETKQQWTVGKTGTTTVSGVGEASQEAVGSKLAVHYSPSDGHAALVYVGSMSSQPLAPSGFRTARLGPIFEATLMKVPQR